MRIRMVTESDVIFGSGMADAGLVDTEVQVDEEGFPYYKGGTFKGVFREALELYLSWTGGAKSTAERILGKPGSDDVGGKLVFSDFEISRAVKDIVYQEMNDSHVLDGPEAVTEAMTNIRTFTRISEEGAAAKGSLRKARCVNKGLSFYADIEVPEGEEELVREVLFSIRWIGTMRNRGFGRVRIEEVKGGA